MLAVKVNTGPIEKALAAFPDEIKKATRNAINDTLRQNVQPDIRSHIVKVFDVKRVSFILNTVKIPRDGFATPGNLRGFVQLDPSRDVLHKFEAGDDKVATRGAKYVAKPGREIRTTGGHVKPSLALARFKPFTEASALHAKTLTGRTRGGGFSSVRDTRPRLVGQQGTFFLRHRGTGNPLLVQRRGTTLRVLWLFVPRVEIDPDLQFVRVGGESAQFAIVRHTVDAIAYARKRAGL